MRIFNLTDIETPILKERGLVNRVLVAGRALVSPGSFVDIEEDEVTRRLLLQYTEIQALAVDALPPTYDATKTQRTFQRAEEK